MISARSSFASAKTPGHAGASTEVAGRICLMSGQMLDYDVEMTYYEPWWVCICSRCGEDHTEFPG